MVRPLARFCVSRGVKFQDFIQLSKAAFVSAAKEKLAHEGKEISHSRVGIMTGLQRPEVKRLLSNKPEKQPKDIITRILGQWERDRRFLDGRKRPRPLEAQSKTGEFAKLVRAVSKDLNPHTVRYELERLGFIKVEGGRVHLIQPEYILKGEPEQTLRFVSEDVQDLLVAGEENAFVSSDIPNLHARTHYDNIPDAHVEKIRESLLSLGKKFHQEARALLARFDRDINTKIPHEEGRNRVVVCTFSRVEELSSEESSETEE
jgi:hypothetical protein